MAAAAPTPRAPKTAARAAFDALIDGAAKLELRAAGLTLYVAEISPSKARAILEHCNESNRRIRQTKVGEYSAYLRRGDWMLRGTLEFLLPSGRLHDGQHRLLAVASAGVPAHFLIQALPDSEGAKASQFTDIGVSRNLADYLHFHGVPEAYRAAPLLTYEKNARVSAGNPFQQSACERTDYLQLFQEIGPERLLRAFEIVPSPLWRRMGVQRAVVDWFALQFIDIDADAGQLFLQYVSEPEGLRRTDPMFVLHERLVEMNAQAGRGRRAAVSSIEQGTMIAKSWNLHYEHKEATPVRIRYRLSEHFPALLGWEGRLTGAAKR